MRVVALSIGVGLALLALFAATAVAASPKLSERDFNRLGSADRAALTNLGLVMQRGCDADDVPCMNKATAREIATARHAADLSKSLLPRLAKVACEQMKGSSDGDGMLCRELLARALPTMVIHGSPNLHNVLATPHGLRWIDFETCCRGPLEADLAYLGEAAARRPGVDLALLAMTRQMLRICVATVCWRDPDRHPRLREAAEYHLASLTAEA